MENTTADKRRKALEKARAKRKENMEMQNQDIKIDETESANLEEERAAVPEDQTEISVDHISELENIPAAQRRQKRRQLGDQIRLKLHAEQREGYYRRWVNDNGNGRLEEILNKGYDFVKEQDSNGRKVHRKVRVGSTSTGHPMYAYLMEIPLQWYLEDQADKQKEVEAVDEAIRGGGYKGQDGSNTTDGFYVPKTGIKITHG